jgi:carbon storage regulator
MLVLSRKRDERVTCVLPDGRELSVAIVDIRGDKVRLGITAPASVMVHR